jgi:hypothetical protein
MEFDSIQVISFLAVKMTVDCYCIPYGQQKFMLTCSLVYVPLHFCTQSSGPPRPTQNLASRDTKLRTVDQWFLVAASLLQTAPYALLDQRATANANWLMYI